MTVKEIRECITPYILERFHKKVKNVWQIGDSNAYCVEGNNGNVICYVTIAKDGQITLVE